MSWSESLVGALVHTLWQGLAAAVGLALILHLVSHRKPALRYALTLVALGGVCLAGLSTFAWLAAQHAPTDAPADRSVWTRWVSSGGHTPAGRDVDQPETDTDEATRSVGWTTAREPDPSTPTDTTRRWISPRASAWLGALWCAGVLVMVGRLIRQLAGARRLVAGARPATEAITRLADEMADDIAPRWRTRVLAAAAVAGPCVVGVVRPVVLLPAAMLTGVPEPVLRAVLAHELAHIRRYDYLVNIVQMVVEALLFFNPFTWWISRQVRLEREACCDRIASGALGDSLTMAEALLHVQEASDRACPSAAPAAAGRGGTLLERVRRLIDPAHRVRLRLSWPSTVGVLVLSVLVLGAAWTTVRAVARRLTPEQRMDLLTKVQQTHGKTTPAPVPATKENQITLSGRVRMEDGGALPKALVVDVFVDYIDRQGTPVYTSHDLALDDKGSFSQKVEYGRISIRTRGPDMTFGRLRLGRPEEGEHLKDIDVVVRRGVSRTIRLVDPDGAPIAGARLAYRPNVATVLPEQHAVTDENGVAVLKRLGDVPVRIEAWVPGWEHDVMSAGLDGKLSHVFPEDRPLVWTLDKTAPARGRVVSDETGKPVAGAELRLTQSVTLSGDHRWSSSPYSDLARVLARTDDQGRFSLNSLHSDRRYVLFVVAEGFGERILEDVRPGRQDMEVRLGRPLHVRGRLVGNLDAWRNSKGKLHLNTVQEIRSPSNGYGFWADVTEHNGTVTFEQRKVFPGKVVFRMRNEIVARVTLDDKPINNLVIRLGPDAPPKTFAPRDVVIRLMRSPGAPSPRGTVHVQRRREVGRFVLRNYDLPWTNGEARVEACVGEQLKVFCRGTVGYAFKHKLIDALPAGKGAFEIELEGVPAGGVYGKVLGADGTLAKQACVSILRVDTPSGIGTYYPSGHDGRFFAGAIPLGDTFRLAAQQGASIALSEPIRLDDDNPVAEVDLVFEKGVDLTGRVLTAKGDPAPNVKVWFMWAHKSVWHTFHHQTTNADGSFTFHGLNPDLPVSYAVEASARSDGRRSGKVPVKLNRGPVEIRLSEKR